MLLSTPHAPLLGRVALAAPSLQAPKEPKKDSVASADAATLELPKKAAPSSHTSNDNVGPFSRTAFVVVVVGSAMTIVGVALGFAYYKFFRKDAHALALKP